MNKPAIVEAIQYNGYNFMDIYNMMDNNERYLYTTDTIRVPGRYLKLHQNDYVAKRANGHIDVYNPEKMERKYHEWIDH